MTTPVRLRLSRAKGFNLQAASLAINGLPAVSVARPSKWGNPYRIGRDDLGWCVYDANDQFVGRAPTRDVALTIAVELFRIWFALSERPKPSDKPLSMALRGKNLACYCHLDHSCHADVLLCFAARGDAP